MKSKLSYDALVALVDANTVEQFLIKKDMYGLIGQFNQQDSNLLVTVLIVNHKHRLADELCCHNIFKIGDYFVNTNANATSGRQEYINHGMDKIIAKYYKPPYIQTMIDLGKNE